MLGIGRFFRDKQAEPRFTAPPLPYERLTLEDHLSPSGPKRVLALDGGGVRGAMAIAILERIEDLLRARHGNHPDFRLSHYFDLIGGTSTGAIIGSALAARQLNAREIKEFYFRAAPEIFRRSPFRHGFVRSVFSHKALKKRLDEVFGDTCLGGRNITTGLAIVTKRVDTDSTWVLHNHPEGLYFNDPPDGSFVGNRHYPLANVIRASTAAPHFFKPEEIEIVEGKVTGLFMDGSVTPHNNPAFQTLMLCGLRNYNFRWTLNSERLLMINIGTGSMAERTPAKHFARKLQVFKTMDAMESMISSAEDFIDLLMHWVGDSPDPRVIDGEIGDLREDLIAGEPLLAYQRYQGVMTREWLRDTLGLSLTDEQLVILRDMSNPQGLPIAYEAGQAMAEHFVKEGHFPARFDLTAPGAPAHPGTDAPPIMA